MSILIIGIALGGVGLGTFAWFSDNDEFTGSIFTTDGFETKFHLVHPNQGYLEDKKFTLEGMLPGDDYTTIGYVIIENPSWTNEQKFRFWFNNFEDEKNIRHLIDLKITLRPGWAPDGWNEWWNEYGPEDGIVVYDAKLGGLNINNPVLWTYTGYDGSFGKEAGAIYLFEAKLNESAGNNARNAELTADLQFQSTQHNNPGWT